MSEDDSNKPTPIEKRLIETRGALLEDREVKQIAYNHTAFCQLSLPYRNPGDVREVSRKNGKMTLSLEAGKVLDINGDFVPIGLPYGPRARLVLIHIMTRAVQNRSPQVELDDSLTAFARNLGLATSGRNIQTLRDQLRRMAACSVRIGVSQGLESYVMQGHLVEKLQLFTPTEPRQRVLWPSYVQLSNVFYESLMECAVPLDPRALSALKHSSAALDCYQWLAQRLHRVSRFRPPGVISWKSLHTQLGGGSKRVGAWKRNFLGQKGRTVGILPQVQMVYPAAVEAVQVLEEGILLKNAPPPIPKKNRILY